MILCPNCNEDVPKTLYCLNCGYPLYKVEQEQAELEKTEVIGIEETPEVIELEPETEPEISSITEEIEAPVGMMVDEAEAEEEPQIISVEEAEEPAETDELAEAVTAPDEVEAEPLEVEGPEILEEDYSVLEAEVTPTEEEPSESIEEAVIEMVEEREEAEETEVIEEIQEEPTIEEPAEEQVQETLAEFEPDPLITVVMENLAKNISLRLRLVNLLKEGDVKEATFNRLFESYGARGERWMNRRNEMLERSRYDLDAMEKALTEAMTDLEELGIRMAIGDSSEEEHQAKAPAFEWDICFLDGELHLRKGEIAYLEDLTRVMSAEAVQELREMAEGCYGALDGLVEAEKVGSETAVRVKASLEEALDCLKG